METSTLPHGWVPVNRAENNNKKSEQNNKKPTLQPVSDLIEENDTRACSTGTFQRFVCLAYNQLFLFIF
jgi:hypothetical protein